MAEVRGLVLKVVRELDHLSEHGKGVIEVFGGHAVQADATQGLEPFDKLRGAAEWGTLAGGCRRA